MQLSNRIKLLTTTRIASLIQEGQGGPVLLLYCIRRDGM